MAKKQSLGKGLDLIFDDNTPESNNQIAHISIESLHPRKNQPRKYFDNDALSELANSISIHGVIQPIIVRDMKNGTYEIIAGERRYRASKLAGLSEIPCIIMEADELLTAQLALIENIQRENLNPIEEAKAYKALIDSYGMSHEEVASKVGKSRSAITNSMRLMDLPEEILDILARGELSAGHCRALLGLRDRSRIVEIAERAASRNLSVRDVESIVRKLNKQTEEETEEVTMENTLSVNYYKELENKATNMAGRRVKISAGKNKNVLQIEYTDNRDLEAILVKLCGKDIIEEE